MKGNDNDNNENPFIAGNFPLSWYNFYRAQAFNPVQIRWKNVNMLCQKCIYDLEKSWKIWRPEPNLYRHQTEISNILKTGTVPGKSVRMGSLYAVILIQTLPSFPCGVCVLRLCLYFFLWGLNCTIPRITQSR
jgi:hypothetical protein